MNQVSDRLPHSARKISGRRMEHSSGNAEITDATTTQSTARKDRLIHRAACLFELPIKRLLFECRACGSCLLHQTGLICPMKCPKGLRNGPCGGTLHGNCEVFPEGRCVWIRIREMEKIGDSERRLRAPAEPGLFGSSSYLNLLDQSDASTRIPIPLPDWKEPPARVTGSVLERKLIGSKPVVTFELRSPRTAGGLKGIADKVAALRPWIDGFNTTSHAGGHRAISSLEAAKAVVRAGGEAVAQVCGRDVSPDQFLDELCRISRAGISNLLCLTGDWPAENKHPASTDAPAWERFFPMDSSQMIYQARHLCENGTSPFARLGERRAPALFIGAAANPYSTPVDTAAARVAQKAACGARFIQTQIVFDADRFQEWRRKVRGFRSTEGLKVLASIPVIGSIGALDVVRGVPGVWLPDPVERRLRQSTDIEQESLETAVLLMQSLLRNNGVDGFHLVPFGASTAMLTRLAKQARALFTLS